jgi:three-Cys-motif partner protein
VSPRGRRQESQIADRSAGFFKGKRPWSVIKDQILGSYITPYLSKVGKLNRRIVLIDAFAGPGKFDDDTPGSPLIICQAAEKHAAGNYLAIFVNCETADHQKLTHVLSSFIERRSVIPILGTAADLLTRVREVLADQTVFLYLDPFGLKGCEFATIEPFLQRANEHSTEIVINLSVPIMHRLAARNAIAGGGPVPSKVQSFHKRLSAVLGGDYWQPIFWDSSKTPEEKTNEVMAKYRKRLTEFGLPYSGSCPVREKMGGRVKYYITFCSRHPDAMLLMNDAMCTAYHQRMHEAQTIGTLFEGTSWKDRRGSAELQNLVVELVAAVPGRNRRELWIDVVQQRFMRFLASEYKGAVKALVATTKLRVEDARGTGRLNDESRLYPP